MSVDPLAEKYPAWSPYNYVMNNPVNLIDPTGMGPTDWIINNLTCEIEWSNNVNKASETPLGFSYIGENDYSIVEFFGLDNVYSTSSTDWGSISVNDFNNKYSARGFAVNNTTASSEMNASFSPRVSIKFDKNGNIENKKFEGLNLNVHIGGSTSTKYPGIDLKLKSMQMNINNVFLKQQEFNSNMLHPSMDGGNLYFKGFIPEYSLRSVDHHTYNINFQGLYADPKSGSFLKPFGVLGLSGLFNSTNLNLRIDINIEHETQTNYDFKF